MAVKLIQVRLLEKCKLTKKTTIKKEGSYTALCDAFNRGKEWVKDAIESSTSSDKEYSFDHKFL